MFLDILKSSWRAKKKKRDNNENILSMLPESHYYHTLYRSLPVSPMRGRFSFNCGLWIWERCTEIHSSWTDWWKTINRLYVLLGHSGSPALILDTWTYILGYGRWGNAPEEGRGWKLASGKWDARLGRGYMELAWSEQSVFSLCRNNP